MKCSEKRKEPCSGRTFLPHAFTVRTAIRQTDCIACSAAKKAAWKATAVGNLFMIRSGEFPKKRLRSPKLIRRIFRYEFKRYLRRLPVLRDGRANNGLPQTQNVVLPQKMHVFQPELPPRRGRANFAGTGVLPGF